MAAIQLRSDNDETGAGRRVQRLAPTAVHPLACSVGESVNHSDQVAGSATADLIPDQPRSYP